MTLSLGLRVAALALVISSAAAGAQAQSFARDVASTRLEAVALNPQPLPPRWRIGRR